MTDYKVGDVVRATRGVNLLEGIITDLSGRWLDIQWGEEPIEKSTINTSWHIEKVSPPLPTKVGAIVQRADGALFVRDAFSTRFHWVRIDDVFGATDDDAVCKGGFEVIFEGVKSDD